MTQDELKSWLTERSYTEDRWGNFKKIRPSDGVLIRYNLQKRVVRIERQVVFSNGDKGWVRMFSGYYKKLTITPEGKLSGFSR